MCGREMGRPIRLARTVHASFGVGHEAHLSSALDARLPISKEQP
jgi:hypothetical protein